MSVGGNHGKLHTTNHRAAMTPPHAIAVDANIHA
jgi:hypothetical protein